MLSISCIYYTIDDNSKIKHKVIKYFKQELSVVVFLQNLDKTISRGLLKNEHENMLCSLLYFRVIHSVSFSANLILKPQSPMLRQCDI